MKHSESKSARLLAICFLSLLCGACSHLTLMEQVPTWKQPNPPANITAMEPDDPVALQYEATVISDRKEYVVQLRASHSRLTKEAQQVLASLKEQALGYSKVRLWIGGTGIAAGIAAAALVVASPANAAAVAGLSSFGSGVVGFQASLAAEGMTRDAVTKIHENVRKKVEQADEKFRGALAKLLPEAKYQDWTVAAADAEKALLEMASAVTFVQMPEGAGSGPPVSGVGNKSQ